MKQKCSSILKIAVALVLALLMVFGSVSTVLAAVVQPALLGAASSVAGTAANADLAGTGAGPYTIYMIPKADMANAGTTYRFNYKNTNDTWGQTSFSFTGRTYQGRPVYSTTFSPATADSWNAQLQVGTGSSFSWDLYAGTHKWSDWNNKYFDANGSGTWSSSITFDTYKLRNGTTDIGTLTWNSTSKKYVLSNQSLTGSTAYKFNVYNDSYGSGSKYFQCSAKTQSSTGSTTMYAYGTRSDSAVISVTPEITSKYTFEWTLNDSQNDDSKVHVKSGSLNITFPTIRTVSYTLGSNVTYSSVSGGTKTANGTIKAENGSNVAITVSYASNYEYDASSSSLNGATVSNSNKTFTFSSISANKSITIKAKSSNTPLTAPTNVKIDSNTSSTVSASPSASSSLTWNNVTNAGSYEIYKDGAKVGTSSATSYTVERKSSNAGSYTVKAVPSDTTLYSTSTASSPVALTINKVQLPAPSASVDKTDIEKGSSVTVALDNYTSTLKSYVDGGYATLNRCYRAYESTGAGTGDGTVSAATDTITPTESKQYFYYMGPTTAGSEYYTQSGNSAFLAIFVAEAKYAWFGDKVNSADDYSGWNNVTYAGSSKFSTYEGNNIYSTTVTLSNHTSNPFSFCVIDSNGSWYWPSSENENAAVAQADAVAFGNSGSRDNRCYGIAYNGKWTIHIDQTNKKVWATNDEYTVTTTARYQSYNLSTGDYNAVTTGTTGGSASPASVTVKKNNTTTLTATPETGYTFMGWYTNEACTTAASGSYTSATYTATPTADTNYYALFKQNEPTKRTITINANANATIKAVWNNQTVTTTASESKTLTNVPDGASVTVTVTPASGYYLDSTTPSLTNNKFTVSSTNTSFTATVAKNATIKTVTNKSSRGTVSVNKTSAHQDESVTITVTPLAGTLKSLTANYANGAVWTYDLTQKTWSEKTAPTSGTSSAPASTGANKFDVAAIGADIALIASGAAQTINMTLAYNSDVTINATFDTYSADSTWYYNGYDTSGNAVSGYHSKQMTESMVSGEKFSYYHVEGRTGTDQLMTVSNGAASSGTRYVYFTASAEGGWSTDENHQYAYFYNNSGDAGNAFPGYKMTKYTTNDYGQNVYRVEIPTGSSPTGVVFNNASNANHKTTNVTDLSKGGYYLLSTHHNDNGIEVHDWQSYECSYPNAGYSTGTEYFYRNSTHNGDYTGDFNTKGFYNHYTSSKDFAKPKDLGTNTGDYYINVLYPNTSYTINGVTKSTGSNPMIIWSAEPLAGDDETVTVYAKDGSIRSESYGSTYANIADTKIYLNNATVGTKHSGNITNQTWETYKAAKGDTLVIKTQIGATDSSTLSNAADLKAKYYVRGFCVNGEVAELLSWNADGLYTLTYKIPEDTELTKIEITPIYYLKDTTANPIVTYRVTGFTDELKAVGAGKPNWGDTLYTYPFYGKLGSNNNALGAYPGQPMVYYKGQYQMQIPQKSTAWDIYEGDSALGGKTGTAAATAVANTSVSGVTMSNGYYDIVHRQIMGYGSNGASADHVQTYDYGDFYKIFNEKKPVDNIVFDFKYETTTHNFETNAPASPTPANLTSTYKNGFELLTNFHGRTVDLFGTPLSGAAAAPEQTTPVYVVSIGGVNGSAGVENIAGYYATEWMVYGSSDGSNYSRISANGKNSIPPEVLVLNDDDTTSFNTTTYPSADASHNITDWKALYTALEAYRGKPVMISYEAADAQIGAGNYATSGGGGATRNDGRWLYSKNGENITSNIKIQYSDDNGVNYTDLDTTDPQVNGLSAYFTNDGVEGEMTYSTTIDPDKTFDFEAKTTNANYKFVGWYMEDGTKITSDNASHTERSGSYTFVAKFMQVQGGQLILSHSVDTNDTYKGAGTAKISAVVKDGDEVVRTYDLTTSDITLDDKIIKSDSTYTIEVTLQATATGNDMLGTTVLANPSGQDTTYFNASSTTTEDKTKTIVLNSFTVASLFSGTTQNVKNIIYHSYFTAATFHYDLLFEYTDRFGETKQFYRQGYLTSAQAANPSYVDVRDVGSERNQRHLMPAFIQTIAPHVSNYGETIEWNFVETGYVFGVQNHHYTLVNTILAKQTKSVKRNVTFSLPYEHSNGIANGGNTGTAATATNFELTGNNAVDFKTIPTLLNNGENGIYSEEGKKNWIAAPATIYDNGTTKYFQYWSVKSTAAAGKSDPEVARCYFQGFNFIALDNYIVTPIYGNESTDISSSGIFTGATYLDTTRNQWNDDTERAKNERNLAADLLFNDFILNYNYKGVELYKNGADSENVEVGVVVERVKELDINQDGSKNTNISNYTSVAQNRETVEKIINGSITDSKFTKSEIAKTELDNKNRIHFYNAFYNGAGWNLEKQSSATKYAYKNYVFRAYTYIKYKDDQNTDQIELSVPTYFTMYDEATANYVAPTTASTNN